MHTTVSMIVIGALLMTATLFGPASGISGPDGHTTSTRTRSDDNRCSLHSRQDAIHNRINDVENEINQRDVRLGKRLNKRDTDLNTRLDRMDNRLKTVRSDLLQRMDAMEVKPQGALAVTEQTETQLNGLDTRLNTLQSEVNTRLNTLQNEVDTRLNTLQNEVDTRLNTLQNEVNTRLNTLQNEVNTQFNRMDNRLNNLDVYRDCKDALAQGRNTSGVYTITPDQGNSINVYCEQRLDGGGWTVFQARKDGSVDFYRDWNTYKAGFGVLTGEFWLGNTNIRLLSKHFNQQLKIELTSPEGEVRYADYSHFSIGDESQKYRLNVTGYSLGTPPGDSLGPINGMSFSTSDQDNDDWSGGSCATRWHGAWWYRGYMCGYCNLNGQYGGTGVTALSWGYTSLNSTRMMIRRRP